MTFLFLNSIRFLAYCWKCLKSKSSPKRINEKKEIMIGKRNRQVDGRINQAIFPPCRLFAWHLLSGELLVLFSERVNIKTWFLEFNCRIYFNNILKLIWSPKNRASSVSSSRVLSRIIVHVTKRVCLVLTGSRKIN